VFFVLSAFAMRVHVLPLLLVFWFLIGGTALPDVVPPSQNLRENSYISPAAAPSPASGLATGGFSVGLGTAPSPAATSPNLGWEGVQTVQAFIDFNGLYMKVFFAPVMAHPCGFARTAEH
jgi:hypothetical protein